MKPAENPTAAYEIQEWLEWPDPGSAPTQR